MKEREGKREPIVSIIYEAMSKGGWWSLPELQKECQKMGRTVLHTSLSARVRELKASPWNRYVRSRIRAGTEHLFEYTIGPED